MKQVYSYQEIGTLIDQGKHVAFTSVLEVRVVAVQQRQMSNKITVRLQLMKGEYCIGLFDREYPTIEALLDAFDMNDLAEIWELLDS